MIISREPIGSPIVDQMDVLVANNWPSLDEFESTVKKRRLHTLRFFSRTVTASWGGQSHIRSGNQIASEKGTAQAVNTAMFEALMQTGNLGLPKGSLRKCFPGNFCRSPSSCLWTWKSGGRGSDCERCWRWLRRGSWTPM